MHFVHPEKGHLEQIYCGRNSYLKSRNNTFFAEKLFTLITGTLEGPRKQAVHPS